MTHHSRRRRPGSRTRFRSRSACPSTTFEPTRVDPGDPPAGAIRRSFDVRLHELDPMGHVNNAVYLDWLDEAVDLVEPSAIRAVPRRYRLEYRAAASPGATLVGLGLGRAAGWSYRLADDAGRLCLGGRLDVARRRSEARPSTSAWRGPWTRRQRAPVTARNEAPQHASRPHRGQYFRVTAGRDVRPRTASPMSGYRSERPPPTGLSGYTGTGTPGPSVRARSAHRHEPETGHRCD